jgi:hypothetical protein
MQRDQQQAGIAGSVKSERMGAHGF